MEHRPHQPLTELPRAGAMENAAGNGPLRRVARRTGRHSGGLRRQLRSGCCKVHVNLVVWGIGLLELFAERFGRFRPVRPRARGAGLPRSSERALPDQRQRSEQPELPVRGPSLPAPAAGRFGHQRWRRGIEQLGRAGVRPLHANPWRAELSRPLQQRCTVGSTGCRLELAAVPVGVPGVQLAASE